MTSIIILGGFWHACFLPISDLCRLPGVIYADHSFYIWDIDHIKKVQVAEHSILYFRYQLGFPFLRIFCAIRCMHGCRCRVGHYFYDPHVTKLVKT